MPDATTICIGCETTVATDLLWCHLCRSSLVDTTVGELASPTERLAAGVLDAVAPAVAAVGLFAAADFARRTDAPDPAALAYVAILVLFIAVSVLLFITGRSIGKVVIGLHVIDRKLRRADLGTMLVREVPGKLISALFGGLGFLMIPIDRSPRGWHDHLASTFVVSTGTERIVEAVTGSTKLVRAL